MSSEIEDFEPGQPDGARRPARPDQEFVCREDSPLIGEGGALQAILYGLPLRAGFTDEVLARIRESTASDQTPMP